MEKSANSLNVGFEEVQKLLSLVQQQTSLQLIQVYRRCEGQESLLLELANSIQAYFSVADPQQRKLEAVYETQLLILEENNHASKNFQSYKGDIRLSKNRIEQVLDKLVDFLSSTSFSDNRMAINDSDHLPQEQSLDSSLKTQRGRTSEMHDFGSCKQQDNEETSSVRYSSQEVSPYKGDLTDTPPIQEMLPSRDNGSFYRIPQRPFESSNSFHLNDSPKQKFDRTNGNACLFSKTENKDNTREFSSFFKSNDPNPLSSSKKDMKNNEYVYGSTPKKELDDRRSLSSENSINLSSNLDLSQKRMHERGTNPNDIMAEKQQLREIRKKNPEINKLVYEKSPKLEQTVNYARLARSVSFLSLKDKKNKVSRKSRKKKNPLENSDNGNSNRVSRSNGKGIHAEGSLSPSGHHKMHLSTLKPNQKVMAIDKENQRIRDPKLRNSLSKTSNSFLHPGESTKSCFNNEYSDECNHDDKLKESTTVLLRGQINDFPQQIYPAKVNNRKQMFTLDFNDWHI
ncbi:hypothetical protein SOMG_02793 [Schizosaccharomyces osmophilus]|uniref:Uncharacterized protein n=1 Tax=Schizosaccharomyces osmophilus TaxID=2545709 RepID=A0AAF0AX82_9SCHI|nr:uncharacterized protein SOMG_02793 [Schizosaccharomyces osmophilus]WBW73624.1 hypothetical protein SOMG_02793 [Schizosaccharomyces osmophilus]